MVLVATPRGLLVDKGYDSDGIRENLLSHGYCLSFRKFESYAAHPLQFSSRP